MTTCGKCGAENIAGDAFCGACGAFLEFAAEEAADDAAAQPGTPQDVADDEPAIAEAPAAPPPELPAPPTAGAGAAAVTAAAAPTCAVCGRVNPAGRTFCISCGERLGAGTAATTAAPAAVSAGPTAGGDPSAAAVPPAPPRGPAKPAWDFPTAPVPVATAPTPPAKAPGGAPDDRGGRSRLPLVAGLAALLLVGGGVAFVVAGGLGGGGTATPSATPASTGPAAATPTSPAATPAPGETPAPTTTPTAAPATVPPGASVGLAIATSGASSRLAGNRAAKNLHDGSPASAWIGKARDREGAWVELTFAPAAVTRIQIWGGWQRDEPRYFGNHRPRNVTVSFDGGEPVPLALQDVLGAQRVDIPPELGIVGATRLRITIVDTYASRRTTAKGSPSKSVAISEIRLFGIPVTP